VCDGLTCIPANEVAFGFLCTRRTSLLELMITRLAEGLRTDEFLALEALATIVRVDETERDKNLAKKNMMRHRLSDGRVYLNIQPRNRVHVIIAFTGVLRGYTVHASQDARIRECAKKWLVVGRPQRL
jgi:hypothetical protein